MKKIFFSILFVFGALCSYAGPYHCGVNQLSNLLDAIEGHAAGTAIKNANGEYNTDADKGWEKLPGICWKVDGTYGAPGDDDKVALEYIDATKLNYYPIRSIDWSNKGYVQLPGVDIVLEQPADFTDTSFADRNELRWLKFINFSGNQFHSITIKGSNRLEQLTSINLSNIPTLEHLEIKDCTNAVVDLTNNKLSFSKLFDLTENISGVANVLKANQGDIEVAFPRGAVDFTDEYEFPRSYTRYSFTTMEGAAITPATNNGQGLFSFGSEYEGKTIKCIMKNAYFPEFEQNGLVYLVTLTSDPLSLKSVAISPTVPTAYQNEAFSFKATTLNFNNEPAESVTAKWEVVTGNGTFSDANAFTTAFTPSTSGNVEIKCVVTQKRSDKNDVVVEKSLSFNVNPARVVSDIKASFDLLVYLTGEEAKFTIEVTDQYGTYPGKTDGIQISANMGEFDIANKIYYCNQPGFVTVTFKANDAVVTQDLLILENDPLDAVVSDFSSEEEPKDSGLTGPASLVVDGNHASRWAASQHAVEGVSPLNENNRRDYPEYLVLDLGEATDICMVEVDWETSRALDWTLSVSSDGNLWEVYGADEPVDMGGGHYISRLIGEAKARYIKLDCLERNNNLGGMWNFSVFEITTYAGRFPNATKKVINNSGVSYDGTQLNILSEGKVSTVVYSIAGQQVLTSDASSVNVSSLNKGCYIAKIINENGTVSTFKFVK